MKSQTKKGAVLITGGAKRLGKAIALCLAGRGFDIGLHYQRSRKEAEQTAEVIRRKDVRCEIFSCDLRRASDVDQLIRKVQLKLPSLNVLINNASLFQSSRLLTFDPRSFSEHSAINVTAPLILSREFARACGKGNIINLLDAHIVNNHSLHFEYLLTKKSLEDFTALAALELAPEIRVNGIAPGPILSPAGKSSAYLKRIAQRIPLKRKGEPDEIARTVQFLIENEYITGQIIFVDGGEHLI